MLRQMGGALFVFKECYNYSLFCYIVTFKYISFLFFQDKYYL
jgi:hypothetical protein